MTKGIYTAPQTQALLSAFAMFGEGDTASERLTQLTRATSANMMRNRRMKLGEDYQENSATSYQYFKNLGINDQTAPIERALCVVKDVQKKEDEARGQGKEFYGTDYLAKQGFNSVQDREAILKLVGLSRTGLLDQLMQKAKEPLGPSTELQEAWKNRMNDPVFQARASEIAGELANKNLGAKGGVGTFQAEALHRAWANLGGKEGNAGRTFKDIEDQAWYDPRGWGNQEGTRSRVEWRAQQDVLTAARRRHSDPGRQSDRREDRGGHRPGLAGLGKTVRTG